MKECVSMEKKMRLIPYKIENITQEANEIPKGVQMIQAPEVWDKGKKGKGVRIAIIDTGCQTDHPDLKGRIAKVSKNFSDHGSPKDITDFEGHGTHVAGTIAAVLNNQGVAGVAPEAELMILKVFDRDGFAQNVNVIKAIDYAIANKARVISMSLGSQFNDPELHEAVKRAVNAEIAVICAAGNEGDGQGTTIERNYPAAYPESICVGAVDLNKNITDFTNTNDQVDLVAPGHFIQSTWNDGKYKTISGTSMATPHVSGAAALIINQCEAEFNRKLTEAEIYAQLIKRTLSLGHLKMEEGNGFLMLNQDTCQQNVSNAAANEKELVSAR
ncbi:S8 family peptidase [Paenibacillus peoriae]